MKDYKHQVHQEQAPDTLKAIFEGILFVIVFIGTIFLIMAI